MEVLTRLTLSPLSLCSMHLKSYRTLQWRDQEKALNKIDVGTLHESLEAFRKEETLGNEQVRTRARQIHNAKTKVLPINTNIENFIYE